MTDTNIRVLNILGKASMTQSENKFHTPQKNVIANTRMFNDLIHTKMGFLLDVPVPAALSEKTKRKHEPLSSTSRATIISI